MRCCFKTTSSLSAASLIVGEHLQSGSAAALYLLSFLAASLCCVLSSCSRGCLHCWVRVGSHQKCCLGENGEVLHQQLEMSLFSAFQKSVLCCLPLCCDPPPPCSLLPGWVGPSQPKRPSPGCLRRAQIALLCFRAAWPGTRTFVGKESSSSVTTGHVKIKLSTV